MNASHLAEMVNDIAINLSAHSDGAHPGNAPERAAVVEAMVTHLQRFWEPTMRAQIVRHLQAGNDDLSPLAREAVTELSRRLVPAPSPGAGRTD